MEELAINLPEDFSEVFANGAAGVQQYFEENFPSDLSASVEELDLPIPESVINAIEAGAAGVEQLPEVGQEQVSDITGGAVDFSEVFANGAAGVQQYFEEDFPADLSDSLEELDLPGNVTDAIEAGVAGLENFVELGQAQVSESTGGDFEFDSSGYSFPDFGQADSTGGSFGGFGGF